MAGRWAAALLAAWFGALAAHAEQVTWMVYDLSPSYIFDGPYKGQGYLDLQQRYFIERLPEFDHRAEKVALARLWYEMRHHDGICALDVYKNAEREQFAVFTRPAFLIGGQRLLIRRDRIGDFAGFRDAEGAVDLDALFAAPGLTGVTIQSRSYGRTVDRKLADPKHNVHIRTVLNLALALQQVAHGHAAFTIGYGDELSYFRLTGLAAEDVTALPILGEPRYVPSRIACSNGLLGRRIVEHLDKVIQEAGTPPDYLRLRSRWTDPGDFAELNDPALWERMRSGD